MPAKKLATGWHHRALGIPKLWQEQILGNRVRIAILDTGQAQLSGLDRPTFEYLDERGRPISPTDLRGHGTACASVAACGKDGVLGIAPKAALSSYRVLDAGDLASKVESALREIAKRSDIDVVLCAFVIDRCPPAIIGLVQALALSGVPVVAAAGNDAAASSAFPEQAPHPIVVAAIDKHGKPFASAKTGSFIDVAAPGEQLAALKPSGDVAQFGESSGAAAIVAGVAASLLGTQTGVTKRRKLGAMLDGLMRGTARKLQNTSPEQVGAGVIDPVAILKVINQGI